MINNKISKISSRKLSLATTLYISLLLFFFDIVDAFTIDTNFQICHDCACKTFLNLLKNGSDTNERRKKFAMALPRPIT